MSYATARSSFTTTPAQGAITKSPTHALAGVLHAGETLRDVDTIDLVNERASDYARWLEREEPRHSLSPRSAAQRHPGVFAQLAATAVAARARIKAELLTKEKGRP